MKQRVAILADSPNDNIDWSEVGTLFTELSELYQHARERRIDIVLVEQSRSDMKRLVASRIRQYNGLTEIWKVSKQASKDIEQPDYIDGTLSEELGVERIKQRLELILHQKDLLQDYRMVGRSSRMKGVAESIERIAPTEMPTLIVGPSGSGKELVARAIHNNSERSSKPFVAINCGALAEGILESELFGHEKGAFTGSVGKRDGLFHKAEGGTIFLDEIGETKPDMQVKLLRVVEDGTYYPVGSSVPKQADVRVVSATNRDLSEAIAEQEFREDLYFRLGVIKITLPPLLERKEDIEPILQHFWSGHKIEYAAGALDLLIRYDWPGNIRQLRNFADRIIALKPGGLADVHDVERFLEEQHTISRNLPVSTGKTVEEAGQELIYRAILQLGNEVRLLRDLITANLPSDVSAEDYMSGDETMSSVDTVEEMERVLIAQVLGATNGNRKEAAQRLGIGERTLYRKLKKYNLQ